MIIGHKKITKLLDQAIEKDNVAGAYIFSGPESVGKFTVAFKFAQKLSGISDKINPNLIVVKPEIEEIKGIKKKRDIKAESIRELQRELGLTAQGDGQKVAIIDDADRMNKTAQNALLKTLEEPNEKVIIILVSQNNKKILPTILSRCQAKNFEPVTEEEIRENMPAGIFNQDEIIFWSLGRPGLLRKMLSDKKELEMRINSEAEMKKIFSESVSEKFSLAESLSKETDMLTEKLNWWIILLRESMLGNNPDIRINPLKSLKLIEKIEESLQLIRETNSSQRLILENLFLNF